MRVLLVKPNAKSDSVVPPIGLGYLAARIRKIHEVEILDCEARDFGVDGLMLQAGKFKPDVVGVQVYSSDRGLVRSYLQRLSNLSPKPVLVMGGPHPSSVPEKVLDEFSPELDYAFAGEAEIGFSRFLSLLEANARAKADFSEVPGLIWRNGNNVNVNPCYFHPDPDEFGMPAWDLLKPETYPHAPYAAFVKRLPVTLVIASRGCPNRCTFCAAGYLSGHRIRYRSPQAIVDEIEFLKHKHGIREVQFSDDNMTADPDIVAKICEMMIDRRLNIPWSCPNGVRIDSLSRPLLQLMRRSGCYSLAVGIESGSRRLLRKIHKGINLDTVHEKLAMIRDAGMLTVGYFILGLPSETRAERKQTIDLAVSLPLDLANFMLYCPLPGTPLYDEVVETNHFQDAQTYSFSSVVHIPDGATRTGLKWDQRSAFLRFYLRPHQMSLLLSSTRSPDHLFYILKRINRWLLGFSLPTSFFSRSKRKTE